MTAPDSFDSPDGRTCSTPETAGQAATPGQAAYVAVATRDDSLWGPWPSLSDEGREIWEAAAQAAIAAFAGVAPAGLVEALDAVRDGHAIAAATPAQAHMGRAWDEWYAEDGRDRPLLRGFAESKYDAMRRAFHAGAQTAIAAAAPAPAASGVPPVNVLRVAMEAHEPENGTTQWYVDEHCIDVDAAEFWALLAAVIGEPHPPQPQPQAAPELAAAMAQLRETARDNIRLRELLGDIGVKAANAPEDGDSFGLLEQIAMRIAAMDVEDDGHHPDGCTCQFCREDEREERERADREDDDSMADTIPEDWRGEAMT